MLALKKKDKLLQVAITITFVLIGISLRLLPHPPNFTPIFAIALFAGVYLSKKIAFSLPLIIMLVSDIFIGTYEPKLMIFVYSSFILCVCLGLWLKKHKKWQTVLGGSILSAVIFFFITNLAVWVFTPWYAKTFSGIMQCYLMALPFFRNTLFGNIFYVTVFFGTYELVGILVKKTIKPKSTNIFQIN